jgi:hypothetical protein
LIPFRVWVNPWHALVFFIFCLHVLRSRWMQCFCKKIVLIECCFLPFAVP